MYYNLNLFSKLIVKTKRPLIQSIPLSSRNFFSLPSFPPPHSTPAPSDLHSVDDLVVKDRYSKKGDLLVYKETKKLPYTKEQLYNVIANVEEYPKFVPFCIGSNLYSVKNFNNHRVKHEDGRSKPWLEDGFYGETHLLESELVVGFKNFKESYISQVECRKWDMVKSTSNNKSKLFKHLTSTWKFKNQDEISNNSSHKDNSSCYVSLEIAFTFSNPLHNTITELFWKSVSERMVSSFENRLLFIYGPSQHS